MWRDPMEKKDRIEREMVVPNPRGEVWEALTSAQELSSWFGDIAEVDLRPGGDARFGWTEQDIVVSAVVEIVEKPDSFAFRWSAVGNVPFDEEPSTLVTFLLSDDPGGGTRVKVVESGLASLPDEMYGKVLEENTGGWESELGDLKRHLAAKAGS
jgi:uncharacterized protein YndB with AHSA1/START domain